MNVPQLRFSGFEREWTSYKLGELTKLTDGTHYTPEYKEFGIPFWSVETITKGAKPKFISEEAHIENIKRCKPEYEDILVTRISSGIYSLGVPKLINWKEDFSIYVSVGLIKSNPKFSSEFLTHYIASPVYKTEFRSKSLLSATPKKINMVDFKNTKISLPEHLEQRKIASFFTLLEKRVERQQEKIEKLEQFKKGMMQKIFSQELRFKDDDSGEFGDWEPTTFHEVADIRRGASPRPIADPKWFSATSKIGWLRISDVTASGVYLKEVTQYLSEDGIKKSVLLEEPHLILSIAATIGKPVINKIPLCIHDGFIVFKNLKLAMLFGYYYLEHFQDKWLQFRQPGSQFNLNSDLVGNLEIMIPSNKEQQKIANFFSVIDEKLEKEREKLIALEEQKKGFMQGMFV